MFGKLNFYAVYLQKITVIIIKQYPEVVNFRKSQLILNWFNKFGCKSNLLGKMRQENKKLLIFLFFKCKKEIFIHDRINSSLKITNQDSQNAVGIIIYVFSLNFQMITVITNTSYSNKIHALLFIIYFILNYLIMIKLMVKFICVFTHVFRVPL